MWEKLESDLTTVDNTYIEKADKFIANHLYVVKSSKTNEVLGNIKFQKGALKETEQNGIFIEDLIAICIDRLNDFQTSDYRCRENAVAITKLEESLMWLRKRQLNRIKRNVLGTHEI
ncbi:MAG: hypothetical protein ACRCW9_04045 [Cetobacterium sp.]